MQKKKEGVEEKTPAVIHDNNELLDMAINKLVAIQPQSGRDKVSILGSSRFFQEEGEGGVVNHVVDPRSK